MKTHYCPNCGGDDIYVSAVCSNFPINGALPLTEAHYAWDSDSDAYCGCCGYESILENFDIDPQAAMLAAAKEIVETWDTAQALYHVESAMDHLRQAIKGVENSRTEQTAAV